MSLYVLFHFLTFGRNISWYVQIVSILICYLFQRGKVREMAYFTFAFPNVNYSADVFFHKSLLRAVFLSAVLCIYHKHTLVLLSWKWLVKQDDACRYSCAIE